MDHIDGFCELRNVVDRIRGIWPLDRPDINEFLVKSQGFIAVTLAPMMLVYTSSFENAA